MNRGHRFFVELIHISPQATIEQEGMLQTAPDGSMYVPAKLPWSDEAWKPFSPVSEVQYQLLEMRYLQMIAFLDE